MTSPVWTDRIARFAEAVMDPDLETPDGIGKAGEAAPKRFSVYRNNVVVSLMEALEDIFPSILALLGQENFDRIARAYVARFPPKEPMMQNYGDAFPQFAANLPALSELPFLVDLARVELDWLKCYHAIDVAALQPDELAGLSPEDTLKITLSPNRSTRLVRSDFAIYDLFNVRHDAHDVPDETDIAQNVLLTRRDLIVSVTPLDHATATFIQLMMDGAELAEAIGEAAAHEPDFNAAQAIALTLELGVFSSNHNAANGEQAA